VPIVALDADTIIAVPADSIIQEVFAPLVRGRMQRYWISWWTSNGCCNYSAFHRYEFLKSRGLLLADPLPAIQAENLAQHQQVEDEQILYDSDSDAQPPRQRLDQDDDSASDSQSSNYDTDNEANNV